MPPGLNLMFGPDPQPPKVKVMKLKKMRTRRKKVKSRSERKAIKQERQKRKEEKKQRRAARREEEKEHSEEEGGLKVAKFKAKRDPKSNHGTEQVDKIILKLLGKSHKSRRVAGKGQKKADEKQKVVTQEETVGSKCKPGMREEAVEGWQEERKLKQKAKAVRSSKKEETSDSPMPNTKEESVATSSEDEVAIEDVGPDSEADLLDKPRCSVNKGAFQSAFEEMLTYKLPSPPPLYEETQTCPSPAKPVTQGSGSDTRLTASCSEDKVTSDHQEKHSVRSKAKRYVKRQVKKTNPSHESSDDEEERPTQLRRRKVPVRRVNPAPSLTESSASEIPNLTDSYDRGGGGEAFEGELTTTHYSDSEAESSNGGRRIKNHVNCSSRSDQNIPDLTTDTNSEGSEETDSNVMETTNGEKDPGTLTMRGGARHSDQELLPDEDVIMLAIQRSQEKLKLDRPTPGNGNCCSLALVQQCQRTPVKLFLQSRGITISNFMTLKLNVAQFIRDNRNTPRVQDMWVNFEVSQNTMHYEGFRRRNWGEYWRDMQLDASQMRGMRWLECWADDIWLQATAWYLNLDVCIIWAGEDTQGRTVSNVDGNWAPVAERKPRLYLGYIVRSHYQSLLPTEEGPLPQCVAQPALDNVLADVMQTLGDELAQNIQVTLESNSAR